MSTRATENASTPPRREAEGLRDEIDLDFAALEAELDGLDMSEELAEAEALLESEETRAAFAALEEELEVASKVLETELARVDLDEPGLFMDSKIST